MRWEDETDKVMRLESEATIAAYSEAGHWQNRTLDACLRYHAGARGDQLALSDAPDRSARTGGHPQQLTYAELEAAVNQAATAFQVVGLEPGSVVAIQSPATTDAIIAMFGAIRAGLIVFQVPILWRKRDIIAGLKQTCARAVIVADRYKSDNMALDMRDAVAEVFTVRYMFGLGDELPDGLISLGGLCSDIQPTDAPSMGDPNAVATVSVASDADGLKVLIPRTHNHWLALLRHLRSATDGYAARVLSTLYPSSLPGATAGILSPLHAGHSVFLHNYKGPNSFATAVADCDASLAIVPGQLAEPLCEILDGLETNSTALGLVSTELNDAPCSEDRQRAIIDIISMSDLALYAGVRSSTAKGRIPLPIAKVEGRENGTALLQTRLRARMRKASSQSSLLGGELQITGAMVPTHNWPRGNEAGFGEVRAGADHYVSTDIGCDLAGASAAEAMLKGRITCKDAIGSQVVAQATLDALYKDVDTIADFAICFEEHPIAGARMTVYAVPAPGSLVDTASVSDQLKSLGAPRHLMPQLVISVPEIPRNEDGSAALDLLTSSQSAGAEAVVA